MRSAPYAAVAIALLTAAAARADEPHVSVELVPSVTAVEPGGKFTVAAVFKIEKHWHLYWLNPGETGTPPDIKWTAPAGVVVGPPQFPTPKTINSGGLTAYGYEDTLTLLYDVTVRKDARGDFELKADANWIVCSDACVAESQAGSVKVSVASKRGPDHRPEDFKAWASRLPERSREAIAVAVESHRQKGLLDISMPADSKLVEFFPPPADFVEWAKPTLTNGLLRAEFRVLPNPPTEHTGDAVAVIDTPAGRRSIAWKVSFQSPVPHKE